MKQFYTTKEVADILLFSEQTIREWVREGKIKAVRPGLRAWRIPSAEVDRLMNQFQVDKSALENDGNHGYTNEHIRTPMVGAPA